MFKSTIDDALAQYKADFEKQNESNAAYKRKMRNLRIASYAVTFVLGVVSGTLEAKK